MRVLLFGLLFAPLAALAQAPEPQFNIVSFNASAEREVPNDLLTAVLAAEAEGPDPAPLADTVNRAMKRALGVAQGYRGVTTRTGSYQTVPLYDKNRIARWRVRQELRLESADFAAAAELVGKLQSTLVVSGMALTVSPEARRRAENALIPEAIAAFEEKARLVREAMKAKGHRLRELNLSGGGGPLPMYALQRRSAAADGQMAPQIEPGTTRIAISASGSIQLQ